MVNVRQNPDLGLCYEQVMANWKQAAHDASMPVEHSNRTYCTSGTGAAHPFFNSTMVAFIREEVVKAVQDAVGIQVAPPAVPKVENVMTDVYYSHGYASEAENARTVVQIFLANIKKNMASDLHYARDLNTCNALVADTIAKPLCTRSDSTVEFNYFVGQ